MVTDKDVSYVAELAHLELTEDERTRMLKDLNSILGYIDSLNELDTANVEPMAQVASRSDEGGERRGDSLTPCGRTNRVLACPARRRCAMRRLRTVCFSKCPR